MAAKPALLAGGNPQVAKADGDVPVQAYIAAMPGWKRDVGRRLDALIVRTVRDVRKAVKWNSPFYGIEGQGWFLNFHCFAKYVKVAFFRGTSLRPRPPGESKHKDVRYLDIHEDDQFDEELVASWIRQAAELPGWGPVAPAGILASKSVTAPSRDASLGTGGPPASAPRTASDVEPRTFNGKRGLNVSERARGLRRHRALVLTPLEERMLAKVLHNESL